MIPEPDWTDIDQHKRKKYALIHRASHLSSVVRELYNEMQRDFIIKYGQAAWNSFSFGTTVHDQEPENFEMGVMARIGEKETHPTTMEMSIWGGWPKKQKAALFYQMNDQLLKLERQYDREYS